MADKRPERQRKERASVVPADRLPVSEFAAEVQGGLSPFGDDVHFPLPPDVIHYRHPSAADHPHLAGEGAAER